MGISSARRGGALLAVLWLSAALAAIAFSLANTVRGEAERAGTAVDGTRAYYLATGAIHRTTLHMIWRATNPGAPPAFKPTGPTSDEYDFPGGRVRVEIIPETARMNINVAPPPELFRVLVGLGVEPGRAQEITAAIVDWRSPASAEGLSLFDQYYLSRNPSFRARHASFEEIEELLLVKGMTPDIFYGTWQRSGAAAEGAGQLVKQGGLADCVSVYGTADRFDVNTAQPAVLAAAGLPPDMIAVLLERRRAMPFSDEGELRKFMPGATAAVNRLRVGGNSIYMLRATARPRLLNGQLSDLRRTVAAQVKFMPPGYDYPYHILRWYDSAWEQK